MDCIAVVTKDRLGLLADVSELLAKHGITIESLSAESSRGTAVVRLHTSKPAEARALLAKHGYPAVDSRSMVLRFTDKPGELARASRLLSDRGINIANLHLLTQRGNEKVYAMETTDNDAARVILADYL